MSDSILQTKYALMRRGVSEAKAVKVAIRSTCTKKRKFKVKNANS